MDILKRGRVEDLSTLARGSFTQRVDKYLFKSHCSILCSFYIYTSASQFDTFTAICAHRSTKAYK